MGGEDQKDEAKLLREKIKNFDPAYRGHISNLNQLKKAAEYLQELQNKPQFPTVSRSSRTRSRNPSATNSTSSRSRSRKVVESEKSASSKSSTKSKKSTSKSMILSKEELSKLSPSDFRSFWKDQGFNET